MDMNTVSSSNQTGFSGSRHLLRLENLPVELTNEILSNLDVESLVEVSLTSKHFHRIIHANRAAILLPILNRDFSPIDHLFRVFDLCSAAFFATPGLDFPVNSWDSGYESSNASADEQLALHPLSLVSSRDSGYDSGDSNHDGKNVGGKDVASTLTSKKTTGTTISGRDESSVRHQRLNHQYPGPVVFKILLTVKQWEREFHRLRFYNHPQHSRILQAHELERLRHGLYAWWKYHHQRPRYFHYYGHAAALLFARQLPTSKLHELRDMWATIRAAVSREVCPSVSTVLEQSGDTLTVEEASRIGWDSHDDDKGHIPESIMSLRPEDVLHLLVHRHRYTTKDSIVRFVAARLSSMHRSHNTSSRNISEIVGTNDGMDNLIQAIVMILRERWRKEKERALLLLFPEDDEEEEGGMDLEEEGDDNEEGDTGETATGARRNCYNEDAIYYFFHPHGCFPWRSGGILDHEWAGTESLRGMFSDRV